MFELFTSNKGDPHDCQRLKTYRHSVALFKIENKNIFRISGAKKTPWSAVKMFINWIVFLTLLNRFPSGAKMCLGLHIFTLQPSGTVLESFHSDFFMDFSSCVFVVRDTPFKSCISILNGQVVFQKLRKRIIVFVLN